ncbi:cysteine desulfurase family protein [Breoghania sp. L-A4]|uniref:cysteine desulfurase family protein n=1 Tax=Breoghania sp. L-A4 TaxID=2304600 RepID=UPI000E360BAF|nr:cysteine desulfurase family protein [Breoghania sp. L-A4]AXS40514.1 cysteine desulfurase [Breoghania sp. L-A4]
MSGAARRIYLDHNASAPLSASARAAVLAALEATGNASSVHGEGRAAHARIADARRNLASCTGADPRNIVFTSGGTEANAGVLTPDVSLDGASRAATRLFFSAVEHASVLSGGRFSPETCTTIPVDATGRIDLDQFSSLLSQEKNAGGVPFVSVMAANNETGVLQPLAEISAMAREAGGYVHVDAVQALGRIPVTLEAWGADVATVSSHKIGGPQGAGAILYANARFRCAPLIRGGGQEDRRRAGTENVAAISGFGAAARDVVKSVEDQHRLRDLRDWLESELTHICPDTVFFGRDSERLANTTNFAVPGMPAETALIACDLAGAAVSSGSACSSGKVSVSHVLKAMAVPDAVARCAIRVSLGRETTQDNIERFAEIWRSLVSRMRPAKAGRAA